MTLHIAALASGNGTNIEAMMRCIETGRLEARISLVLSNNPKSPVVEKARAKGIAVWSEEPSEYSNREDYDQDMVTAIKQAGADTIVLAGYMRILSALFIQAFPQRILNIHPALLPSFPGRTGAADAVEYGVRFTGATVHFVDEKIDHGPVIIQAVVPVGPNDTEETLMPRIHTLEHRIYPQALQWLAQNRLHVEGRKVHLRAAKFPTIGLATMNEGPLGPWMVSPPLEEGF